MLVLAYGMLTAKCAPGADANVAWETSLGSFVLASWSSLATASSTSLCYRGACSSTSRQPQVRRACASLLFCPPIHLSCGTHAYYSEKLVCELLLIQQNMEVMIHLLGVQAEDDLGDLRLPFAVAAHLGPDGCRFMVLSPDENERGLRPCICLARVPWTDYNCILTGFAHIVVRSSACRYLPLLIHPCAVAGVRQAILVDRQGCRWP